MQLRLEPHVFIVVVDIRSPWCGHAGEIVELGGAGMVSVFFDNPVVEEVWFRPSQIYPIGD